MASLHDQYAKQYALFMVIRNIFTQNPDYELLSRQFKADADILQIIRRTRYLRGREHRVLCHAVILSARLKSYAILQKVKIHRTSIERYNV